MIGVLGATGKTGAALVDALREHGEAYRALSRSTETPFDWDDESTWESALDGVTAAYLVKPPYSSVMTEQVQAFLATPHLERVVLLSEAGCENKPADYVNRSVELVVERAALESTILRPNWFFQNFSTPGGRQSVKDGSLPYPTGDAPMAWIDVRDIADVARLALTEPGHDGQGYELSGPESFGIDEVARRISSAVGREVGVAEPRTAESLRDLPPDTSDGDARYAGLLLDVVEGKYANVTGTVEELTGHPARRFDDFVAENVANWR